jgi:multiple antibiotic resistance protein
MITEIVSFLVILNPFAQFVYLSPIMKELDRRDFMKVLLKATLISFGIFSVFMIAGDFIFNNVLMISFGSFRIFGGIVLFSYSFYYIVEGKQALVRMHGNLDDLASEIALPFMVGAGTISVSLLIGHKLSIPEGLASIGIVLVINYIFVVLIRALRKTLSFKKHRIAFDKNMQILMRLNGFLLGAIGINLIIVGIMDILPTI